MLKGLYTAYTGMINEQNRMDVLTNNLANADTAGFKKEGATSQSFDEVLAVKIKDSSEYAGLHRNMGKVSLGVKVGEKYTDFGQGSFRLTDNTYDVALSGPGFFTIQFTNKAGETSLKYTRDGSFTVNKQGYLVTKDGDYVMGENGRIQVDPLKLSAIDSQGNISQDGEFIDTIRVTDFEDYNYLKHYGENYYEPVRGAQMKEDTDYKVVSGYLEMANVQVVSEMVEMISVSRAYETNQKMIQTFDSTLDIAANQLGKV